MKQHVGYAIVVLACFFLPSVTFAQTYSYDTYGRVTSVTQPNGTVSSYSYDTVDNRTAAVVTLPGGSATVINVTAASNLRTLANSAGYAGASSANYQFVVPSGTTVTGATGGGIAIDTGTWPTGATISLVISGNVYGGGGNGGHGALTVSAGGAGGDGIYVQAPISITVSSGASVKAGGGGGGGGGYTKNTKYIYTTPGGGGGGGFPNGNGGTGGNGTDIDGNSVTGSDGNAGTSSGGGAGGSGAYTGGAGGGAATAGSAGGGSTGAAAGAAGYAIRYNSNTVTLTNSGTVSGTTG